MDLINNGGAWPFYPVVLAIETAVVERRIDDPLLSLWAEYPLCAD